MQRRAFLAWAATGLGVAFGTVLPGIARAAGPIRAVRIDTGPLAAKGVSRFAAVVRAELTPIAAAGLAGRLSPGDRRAPTLVIEVDQIQMASYGGGGGGPGRDNFDAPRDYIVGAGILIGPDGRVIARHPVTASRFAHEGGSWYMVEESERRRLQNLCESLVHWIARAL